jgi:opacity protein-like surface antigen
LSEEASVRPKAVVLASAVALLGLAVATAPAAAGRAYVGGGVGHSHVHSELTMHGLELPVGLTLDSIGGSGPVLGGVLGYEIERGALRLGVELDFNVSDVAAHVEASALGDGGEARLRAEHTLMLACRLGCELADGIVLFGRIGYGYTQYSTFIRSNVEPYDTEQRGSGEAQLVALGLGAEAALRDGLAIRGDYSRHTYQDADERESGLAFAMRSTVNTVRLSFVYRF